MSQTPTALLAQAINQYRKKFVFFQKVYLFSVLPSIFISYLLFIYSRDLNLNNSISLLVRLSILVLFGLAVELSTHLAVYQLQADPKVTSPFLIYRNIFHKVPNYILTILLFFPLLFLILPIFYLPLLPFFIFQQKDNNLVTFPSIHKQIWPFFLKYLKYFFTFFTFSILLFWLSSLLQENSHILIVSILFQLLLTTTIIPIGLLYFRLVYLHLTA